MTEQCDTLLLKAASQTGSSTLLQPTRLTEPRFLELLPAPGCCRYLGAAVIKHVRAKRGTSHPVHQSFCLSPTCSGVSELPGLSVEPPAVTNTCLAEKAKYQRLARLIVYNVLTWSSRAGSDKCLACTFPCPFSSVFYLQFFFQLLKGRETPAVCVVVHHVCVTSTWRSL